MGTANPAWEQSKLGKRVATSTYTRTFTAAHPTHANATAVTLTDNSGGVASNTIAVIKGGGARCEDETKDAVASLTGEVNNLIADIDDVKQLINQLINDLQASGDLG